MNWNKIFVWCKQRIFCMDKRGSLTFNTLTGRWTTCGPSKTYPLAGRWTQRGPSIQQFAKNRGILLAGSCFGSYMVHELYSYTNKHWLQSSLIISACQCSVGNYWVWLWCVLLPLATAPALKCLPCVLLFILYFDVSGEYCGIVKSIEYR